MMRQSTLVTCAFIAAVGAWDGALQAQDTSKLVFDVSTVKPTAPDNPGSSFGVRDGNLKVVGANLKNLIGAAWSVRPDQVAGEPAWADDEHWDVTGKVTDTDGAVLKKLTDKDLSRMEQTLLAERFHVKAHIEMRTAPVFNLVPAKGGIKLKLLQPVKDGDKPDSSPMPRGTFWMRGARGGGVEMAGHGVSLKVLINNIAGNLQRTIIDKTGLPSDAAFDFTIRCAFDATSATSQNGDAPSLREALEDQLGLRLESTRGPVPTVVVDQVGKPEAN